MKIGMEAKKKVQRENRLLPFDDQCTMLEKVRIRLLKTFSFPVEQNSGPIVHHWFPSTYYRLGTFHL